MTNKNGDVDPEYAKIENAVVRAKKEWEAT